MNSGSSYALKSARFLVIFSLIGTILLIPGGLRTVGVENLPCRAAAEQIFCYDPNPAAAAGSRRDRGKERWRPLPGEIDIMLLRNQPRHIIEGTGAAGMLLGESELQLRHKYGEPAYRDHASPETLYYTEQTFSARFRLKNGRIAEIILEVEKHKSPSLEWFTALGLQESDLRGHSAESAADMLSQFYATRRVRRLAESVDVLSRGIGFWFRGKSVISVTVREVEPYPH